MEPLELGADENVHAVPVEGGEDWVIIASAQPGIRLWRWTPGARPAATELPAKLAALASFGLLHPDGRRMVIAHADETGQHSQVSVVDLRPATFTTFTLASPYTELAGWAGDGGRLVLGHHICTEGCEGRHAYLAWLDPTSGRVSPFGATDRDSRVPAWFVVPYPDRGEVLLTSIHEEEADDIVLRWPAGEPMPDIRYHDWTASPTDLYLELVEADVATLAVVRDAASLGPGRHQTSPERLGALPAGLRITSLGPLEGWVMAADRADELYLIDLQRGTAGPISRSEPGSVQWDDGR
jgi:hypothetical protein